MPFNLRSPIVGLLILCYGTAALFGQGLHYFVGCEGHRHCCDGAHEHHGHHEHDVDQHDVDGHDAETSLAAAGNRDGAYASACPICEYNAQGQCSAPPVSQVSFAVVCAATVLAGRQDGLAPIYHPYAPRGPPAAF